MMRLVLIVPRFPRLSETFIASKFVGLVDAGWDVHIVCHQIALEEWDRMPSLAGRSELRKRVHAQWRHEPRWAAVLLWLPVLLMTVARAPRAVARYWRAVRPRFGWGAFKRFYMDATLIALGPDILHFEFGALAVEQTYLKEALDCALGVSFRGYDLNYAGLENPDHYAQLWAAVDAVHVLGLALWQTAVERGCPPDKPHALIPPAIDKELFAGGGLTRQMEGDNARALRILSVGRLEWVKGYEYALCAARELARNDVPFEYRIIGEGSYLDFLRLRQRMSGRKHCAERFRVNRQVFEAGWALPRKRDTDIGLAGNQRVIQFAGQHLAELDIGIGVSAAIGLDQRRQNTPCGTHREADTQHPPLATLGGLRASHRGVQCLDDAHCLVVEMTSRGRHFHLAGRALEQSHAEFIFEGRDLAAQRGLRDVQAGRCTAEMQRIGQGDEIAKLPEVDGHRCINRIDIRQI